METHSYRKKYVNGSVNSEGHIKKIKKPGATHIYAYIYIRHILSPTITFVKLNDKANVHKKQFNLIMVEMDGDVEQD